jgi:hypothetical protein
MTRKWYRKPSSTAILILEQVEVRQAIRQQKPDAFRTGLAVTAAERLQKLTEEGPSHLKLYAITARKVAELDVLLHESFGLYLNIELTRQQGGNLLWIAQLLFRWATLTDRINRKLRQCFRLINLGIKSPHGWAASVIYPSSIYSWIPAPS